MKNPLTSRLGYCMIAAGIVAVSAFGIVHATANIPSACSTPGDCAELTPTFKFIFVKEHLTANQQGDVRMADSDSSNYVGFQAPAAVGTNLIWTLPSVDGNDGQVLMTDGSGVLRWGTPAAGGDGASGSFITDADQDTLVQTEEGTDDDTIRFDTGGAQRAIITSAGAVGIGDATPDAHLEVSADGTTGSSVIMASTDDGNDGNILDVQEDGDVIVGINDLTLSSGSVVISKSGEGVGGAVNHATSPRDIIWDGTGALLRDIGNIDLIFDTNNNDSIRYFRILADGINRGVATELLRLTSAGSLGIGDTSPDAHLEVSANGSTGSSVLMVSSDDSTNGDLLIVEEEGDVGIGDTTPDAHLEVSANGSTGSNVLMVSANDSGNGDLFLIQEDSDIGMGDISPDAHLEVSANGTTGSTVLLISSDDSNDGDLLAVREDSNVGMGDNTPNAHLEVSANGTTGSTVLMISADDNGDGDLFKVKEDGETTVGMNDLLVLSGSVVISKTGEGVGSAVNHTTAPRDIIWDGTGALLRDIGNIDLIFDTNNNDSVRNFRILADGINRDAATELLRLTSSGSLGLHDSDPDALFEISLNGETGNDPFIISANDSGDGDLFFVSPSGRTGIGDNDPDAHLEVSVSGGAGTPFMVSSNDLLDGDMFIIVSSGKVGIGTSTPNDGQVEVKGGTVCVDTDSDDSATSCITSESDIRLKKNIQPVQSALEKIRQINGVTFDWRWDEYDTVARFAVKPHGMGVIAQEVEAVFPEALSEEIDGFKTVDYDVLVAPLIEAVKELDAKVQTLEAELAALKAAQ